MKRLVSLVSACLVFVFSMAQTVQVTTDKTTSLIFPFPISHVDRGAKDVLVQLVKESDNILLIKAASKQFAETNLTVVTDDGSVYSFLVNYTERQVPVVYYLPELKKATIARYASCILDNPRAMRGIRDRKWDMEAKVTGIYIKENVIYYQLRLDNKSPIDYDIELLRFYIRDKKKGKRTASQENELKPLHIAGNTRLVKANSTSVLAIALEKFTVPDAKYLAVEVMEKNGGRQLLLKVNNNKIIKAISLPDLR